MRPLLSSQLQFELRVVAGRDALRQALLAMVPQIDELQKKREAMKQVGIPPCTRGLPGSVHAPTCVRPCHMPDM